MALLATATLLATFVALSSTAGGAHSATATGLTVAQSVAPDTLDPQASQLNQTWLAFGLSYECLVRATPSGEIEPVLATRWKESASRKVYDFTLRRGVKFHDGHELTSADVVYTFRRLLATGHTYAKSNFETLKTIRSTGKYSVRFTLSEPRLAFMLNMGNVFPVGCGIMSKNATATRMVGTGPWRQTSYTPKQSFSAARFSSYWDVAGRPKFRTLRVLYIPEQASQIAALRSGNVNVAFPDADIMPALRADRKLKISYSPSASNYRIYMNNVGKMSDIRVRQAVLKSINTADLARRIFLGFGYPSGLVPSQYTWAPRVNQYQYAQRYSVAEAKRLLAAAGYDDGISLNYMTIPGFSSAGDRMAQVLKSQMKEAGIELNIQSYDTATWLDHLTVKRDFDLSFNIHPYFADPLRYAAPQPNVYRGPTPPALQAAWDAARNSTTLKQYGSNIAKLALEEDRQAMSLSGLASQTRIVAYASNLRNVKPTFTGSWDFLAAIRP